MPQLAIGVTTSTRGAMTSRAAYKRVAQATEQLGFSLITVNDHVVVPRDIGSRYPYSEDAKWAGAAGGHNFDVLAMLAFLAGCTDRIGLMSSVMVVPHRQPILTAKMLATIDVMSEGRLIVGCGAGWMKEEFEALETKPYEDRGRVTDEYIEAFKALWTQDAPAYQGKHVTVDNLMFEPKPFRKPHPPIWIGGESQPARRRAAKLGDAWYPGSINPQFRLDTPERLAAAWTEVQGMAEKAKRDPKSLGLTYVVLTPVDWTAKNGHDTPRRIFTGSSADMAADAAAFAKIGVSHLNLTFQAATVQESLDRMQRFAEEVLPKVGV
jgi:probable F420-dependent oxidoreductase